MKNIVVVPPHTYKVLRTGQMLCVLSTAPNSNHHLRTYASIIIPFQISSSRKGNLPEVASSLKAVISSGWALNHLSKKIYSLSTTVFICSQEISNEPKTLHRRDNPKRHHRQGFCFHRYRYVRWQGQFAGKPPAYTENKWKTIVKWQDLHC